MFERNFMEIKTFYFNPIRECCHLAWDASRECVIVDPGCYGENETGRLTGFVRDSGLTPVKILLTHCHFDHILGLSAVAAAFPDAEVCVNPLEDGQLKRTIEWCAGLGLKYTPYSGPMHWLHDGDTVAFGRTSLEVIATPGHTEGGVCFYCKEDALLFSGDTLFAGSIGRTDHPGGDYDQLINSITTRLMTLDGEVKVLPGHGYPTSVGYERATNPFIIQ